MINLIFAHDMLKLLVNNIFLMSLYVTLLLISGTIMSPYWHNIMTYYKYVILYLKKMNFGYSNVVLTKLQIPILIDKTHRKFNQTLKI